MLELDAALSLGLISWAVEEGEWGQCGVTSSGGSSVRLKLTSRTTDPHPFVFFHFSLASFSVDRYGPLQDRKRN